MIVHSSSSRFIERFVDSVTTMPVLNDLVRMKANRRLWTSRVRVKDFAIDIGWATGRDEAA